MCESLHTVHRVLYQTREAGRQNAKTAHMYSVTGTGARTTNASWQGDRTPIRVEILHGLPGFTSYGVTDRKLKRQEGGKNKIESETKFLTNPDPPKLKSYSTHQTACPCLTRLYTAPQNLPVHEKRPGRSLITTGAGSPASC